MKIEKIAEEPGTLEDLHGRKGYDPLEAALRESSTLNFAWFKNGALNLIQRAGFTILSLLFLAGGVLIAGDFIESWREIDFGSLAFAGAGIFCFAVGVLGIRNVLRFEKKSTANSDKRTHSRH